MTIIINKTVLLRQIILCTGLRGIPRTQMAILDKIILTAEQTMVTGDAAVVVKHEIEVDVISISAGYGT